MHRHCKVFLPILVCLFLSPSALAQETLQYRIWTDSTGKFEIEAAFVKMEGGVVHLKRKDNGETLSVPIRKMSQADLAIARRMNRESQSSNEPSSTSSEPSSTPLTSTADDTEPTKKSWTGSWNNRKYGTNGPVTCIAVIKDEKRWQASFVGKGLGKPFKYDVEITTIKKGEQIQLQGNSKVDGDTYRWNGYVRGNVLYGRYRSGSGNNGEFQLKETRLPPSTLQGSSTRQRSQ